MAHAKVFDDSNSLVVVVCRAGTEGCDIGDFVTVRAGGGEVDLIVMARDYKRSLCILTLARLG